MDVGAADTSISKPEFILTFYHIFSQWVLKNTTIMWNCDFMLGRKRILKM